MLRNIITGWTILKFVRVGLGLLILFTGIESHSTGNIVAGIFFTVFGVLAPGTCCATSCFSSPGRNGQLNSNENIEYEELGLK